MTVANLRDISALQRLSTAFARFDTETREALLTAKLEAQRTLSELEAKKRECELRARRTQEVLQVSARALAACEASGYTDKDGDYHAPNCSLEQGNFMKAKRAVEEAQLQLELVVKRLRLVSEQVAVFGQQSQRFAVYCDTALPKGINWLNRASGFAQEYIRTTSNTSFSSNLASQSTGGFEKLIDAAIGAPLGLLEALSGILSGTNPQLESSSITPHKYSIPNHIPAPRDGGVWAFVPLEQINLSDNYVQSETDFKKVSLLEMERGWNVFYSDVYPAIQQGANADYFSSLDETLGIEYEHGLRRVFDAFLGSEPIRLERQGEKFVVINGFHRIFTAKKLGLNSVVSSLI